MDPLHVKIRRARLAYGMSQAELARRIGISRTAMNDIEQGRTTDPGFGIVQRIAETLRISLDQLAPDETPREAREPGAHKERQCD